MTRLNVDQKILLNKNFVYSHQVPVRRHLALPGDLGEGRYRHQVPVRCQVT